MKIAVISDIHANLEALNAVIARIDSMEINLVYCLGDIVGYGPDPNECIRVIHRRNLRCVAGNHDRAAAGDRSIEKFSPLARYTVDWTKSELTAENREYLKNLPYSIEESNALFLHASPELPEEFRYILNEDDAADNFAYFSTPICFIGHTHQPVIFLENGNGEGKVNHSKRLVNAGSVGQPRDGDWRACFAVYDSQNMQTEFIRVEYDVESTCGKILSAGFPKQLCSRLVIGV